MSQNIFINSTVDNPEPDAESRRKIRSQAMRDYRRRQRVEDGNEASSPEGSPSSPSSPQLSSASGSRRQSRQRNPSSNSLPVKPDTMRRQSSGTSQEELPSIEDLTMAKGKRRSSQSALRHDDSADNSRRQKRTAEPRVRHGTFSTFTINIRKPSHPTPSLDEEIDPLSNPGQLEWMLSICESYNRWLASSLASDVEPTIAQTTGPWDNSTSQMLLFALCLKAIGHLDAIHPSHFGGNRWLFKTRVLALANKRLKNPAKALEDKTIGALACLTSYEITSGSGEAMMHLSGLSQIIKLRGGVNKIENTGLHLFLEMLDLIHAVVFHTSPMYTSADNSQPGSTRNTPHLQPYDTAIDLDQQTLDEISSFIMNIPEMDNLGAAGMLPDPSTLLPEAAVTPSSFENEVEQWHQSLVQTAHSIAPSYEGSLAYVCSLAAGLHLATTSAITPHPMRLQAQTEELFRCMTGLPENAWDAFRLLHVRILLTALSGTRDPAARSWYNAHLTRSLYQLELENWSSVKSLMLRFIDMQRMARFPRTKAVRAVVNDIEIVVDSSEAREKGWRIQTELIESGFSQAMEIDASIHGLESGRLYGLDPDLS